MKISEWLKQAQTDLETAGIATARLDCLVLLADALERDKSWLLSHSDEALQGSILKILNTKIVQRAQHIPLAYLRGHAEFYGRDAAEKIQHAEAFEVCEYGRQPNKEELKRLFPFFGE